jgi:hypothetical protein
MNNHAVQQVLKGEYKNVSVTVNVLAKEGARLDFKTVTTTRPDGSVLSAKDVAVLTYSKPFGAEA